MKRNWTFFLFVFLCILMFATHAIADDSLFEINHVIILDATGSMNTAHAQIGCNDSGPPCPNGTSCNTEMGYCNDGAVFDRFYCAQSEATKRVINVPGLDNYYYGLYVFTSYGSYSVIFDNGTRFTNDPDEIIEAILNTEPTPGATPMADAMCEGMNMLGSKSDNAPVTGTNPDGIDESYLLMFTDARENDSNSSTEYCGDFSYGHEYDGIFTTDGTTVYPLGKQENDDRIWIPIHSTFWSGGRAYDIPNGTAYDWSVGARPGSWQWRVYNKIAWSEQIPNIGQTPEETENKMWGSGPPPSHVTAIIEELVTVASPMPTAALTASSEPVLNLVVKDNTEFYENETSKTATPAATTLSSSEDSFFAGIAELTGGKFVHYEKGAEMPTIGDLNGDREVDDDDWQIISIWFGKEVDSSNQQSIDADVSGNGFVDNGDIIFIRSNWTDEDNPPPNIGDIDYSGCVDYIDADNAYEWYLKEVDPENPDSYYADINADGLINDTDLEYIWENWGEGCGYSGCSGFGCF